MKFAKLTALAALSWVVALVVVSQPSVDGVETTVFASGRDHGLDRELRQVLKKAGFTGDIERMYKKRLRQTLGRPFDPQLADLGRLLWFDKIHSLNRDNIVRRMPLADATAWATRSRWRSAFRTTTSSVRTAPARAISAERRPWSTPRSIRD